MQQTLNNVKQNKTHNLIFSISVIAVTAGGAIGQSDGKNNPYSPSPSSRTSSGPTIAKQPGRRDIRDIAFVKEPADPPTDAQRPTIAQQTYEIAKKAGRIATPIAGPTEHYKVGIGDVLFVDLKNAPRGSGYYTVKPDGTIDFPLAGDNVVVAGRPVEDITEQLSAGITLYPDPALVVKVREYTSHQISVSGMVENAGQLSLQREAVPLFVVRAQAVVDSKATKVTIRRTAQAKIESYDLSNPATDSVLIYPGNIVEFTSERGIGNTNGSGYYFIAGDINQAGQKVYSAGLTLLQAILAAGGQKGKAKTAVVRRKNDKGTLDTVKHTLKSIKKGEAQDPLLQPGDMIEIG
jgi:polysaccharide export outer membrane protein